MQYPKLYPSTNVLFFLQERHLSGPVQKEHPLGHGMQIKEEPAKSGYVPLKQLVETFFQLPYSLVSSLFLVTAHVL